MQVHAWWSDPAVRFNLLRSVFDARILAFLCAGLIAVSQRSRDRVEWFAIFIVSVGVIKVAVELLEMQSDGRLDQIRLAGRRPRAFLMTFLLTTAGPWAVLGLLVLGWSRQTGEVSQSLLETGAIIGAFLAVIAAGTKYGLNQRSVDPRIAIAALVVIGIAMALLGDAGLAALTRLRKPTAPLLLIIEAVAIAWFTSGVIRQITYPPSPAPKKVWGIRLPLRGWMLRWPGMFRGARVASNGVALVFVFAPALVAVRLLFRPASQSIETAAMYLLPVGIGFITVSLLCREDLVSGRLELIRQSSTTPIKAALELLIGMWAPFVVASAVLAILVWTLFGVTQFGIGLGIALLALAAPLPMIEGWSRLWPFTYTLPYLVAFVLTRGWWPVVLAMSALQWWAVVQRFANPDRPVLDGWPSVAATAGFYVAVMTVPPLASPLTLGIVVVPVVFAISPLLIGERAGPSRYLWVTPPAIAVATVAVLLPRFGVAAATAIAVSAIAAWIAAFRIIAVLPARPLAQATVRLALLLCLVITAALMDTAVYQDLPGGWILGATGIALCVIAELAARAAARFSRARIRPVIPRA